MKRKIEQAVEWVLWNSRFITFIAAVASLLSALILVGVGTYEVVLVGGEFMHGLSDRASFEAYHQKAVTGIISAVDAYLIATVLLIFGLGLYELFISRIDLAERNDRSSRVLVIHTLDELKEKLAKVIIMVLIVVFFKNAVGFHYDQVLSLLYLALGILLIALAVWFMGKAGGREDRRL